MVMMLVFENELAASLLRPLLAMSIHVNTHKTMMVAEQRALLRYIVSNLPVSLICSYFMEHEIKRKRSSQSAQDNVEHQAVTTNKKTPSTRRETTGAMNGREAFAQTKM